MKPTTKWRARYVSDPTGLPYRFDYIRPMPLRGGGLSETNPGWSPEIMHGKWSRDSVELDDRRQKITLFFSDHRDFVTARLAIEG